MPRKPKPPGQGAPTADLQVPEELLDQLVKGPMSQDELESMFRSLKKAVIERAMGAEMSDMRDRCASMCHAIGWEASIR
jgi:hypothetical protein